MYLYMLSSASEAVWLMNTKPAFAPKCCSGVRYDQSTNSQAHRQIDR